MAVISITTTQNIELEYELASVGERIVACIIDFIILAAYFFIVGVSTNFGAGLGWVFFLLFLPVTFYTLLSETYLNGQTVGKKVMAIKVISLSGNQPAFSQYLIRWLFRLVDIWFGGCVIATIMVAASQKHQRIGDIIAGTTLIRTRPKNSLQQTIYTPVAENNYHVNYPEVVQLSDRDMQLIREVIISVQKSGNTMLALQTMHRVENILKIKSRHEDPMNFLYVVLNDYNHLTAKM